jgi:broad-specificity NMP kinase
LIKEIDLGVKNSPNAPYYESWNIYSKYYSIDNLPLEEELISDYKRFINIYNDLADDNSDKFNVWKITPGEGQKRNKLWKLFQEDEVISIGWFGKDKDYSEFTSLEEVKKEMENYYGNPKGLSAKAVWEFTNVINNDDIIIANAGFKKILGIGIIKSHYIGPENPLNPALDTDKTNEYEYYVHFRKVKWVITDELEFSTNYFDQKTVTKVPTEKWMKIKNEYITKFPWTEKIFTEIENEDTSNSTYDSFSAYLNENGFLFNSETIENFLLSLKVKPFIILTGNSGTGKTKLAQLFSKYICNNNEQYKIVPVGANWTENRHLLGFYNVIMKKYQETSALELIINSISNPNSPHFLILDEMNLSHVERYFADFLSAMESEEPILLYKKAINEVNEIPNDLKIPNNTFVIGTVNVDETTYMFSPKVLDRANTIEFSSYPAESYMLENYKNNNLMENIQYLEDPLSDLETRNYKVKEIKERIGHVKIDEEILLWNMLAKEIQKFQEVLGKAGFDFGFRVIDEISRFMYVAWVYEGEPEIWDNWMRYFDAQIKQKMLPKLHGSQRVLENVLIELFELCIKEAVESSPRFYGNLETDQNVKYLSASLKIQEMDKVLNEQRYVSFIN